METGSVALSMLYNYSPSRDSIPKQHSIWAPVEVFRLVTSEFLSLLEGHRRSAYEKHMALLKERVATH